MNFKTEAYLGQSGDAVILHDSKKIYLSFMLENETFIADYDGNSLSNITLKSASPQRQDPLCHVFGECGGCAFQHMNDQKYKDFKMASFKNIFDDIFPAEHITYYFCSAQTRRRTTLSLYKEKDHYIWGYKARASKKIIPFNECHIVTQPLNQLIQEFMPVLKDYIPSHKQVKCHITVCENGFDIVIRGCPQPKDKYKILFLKKIENHFSHIIRVTWDHILFYQKESPFVNIDNKKIMVAPEMFLQPSNQGQEALTEFILSYIQDIGKKKHICDLFCGAGTFSLPMTGYAKVDAFDNAGGAIASLRQAVNDYGLQKKLTVFERDLYRDPVSTLELKKYDAVITDPPRNGMLAQVKNIAKAKIKTVIMIFCDPKTAHRDSQILLNAGYKLEKLMMIDQFVYSHHIEGGAVFTYES